ncbi:Hypothetical protein A7982_09967 [Minicystis rosea]|nr:Hypothetical protein A7982_09967 [Minicystis rosea]
MTACARCREETPPAAMFFSHAGDQICRRCHAIEQNAAAESRARESLQTSTPDGLKATSAGNPTKTITTGASLMALGLIWFVGGIVYLDHIYFFPLFLVGSGFYAFARGLKMRR